MGARGNLTGAALTGLTVAGAPATVSPNGRVALGDWGYAITLEQAEVHGASARAQSYRGYVTALDIHLTAVDMVTREVEPVAHGIGPASERFHEMIRRSIRSCWARRSAWARSRWPCSLWVCWGS